MKKKLTSTLLLGSLLASNFGMVSSVQADDYTNEINNAENRLSEIINQETSVIEELKALNNEIKENEAKIKQFKNDFATTQEELQTLREEIAVLEEKIAARDEKLIAQVRALQVDGNTSNIISFILESESIGDIIGRIDLVNEIVTANRSILEEQQADKDAVEVKETETVAKTEKIEKDIASLQEVELALEGQQLEQEVLKTQLAIEKATVTAERDELIEKREAALEAARQYELELARHNRAIEENLTNSNANTTTASENNSVTTASSSVSSNSSTVSSNTQSTTNNQATASAPAAEPAQPAAPAQPAPAPKPAEPKPAAPAPKPATPSYSTSNTYGYGWCTWWAAERRAQMGRPVPNQLGNAMTWLGRAPGYGLSVGYGSPAVGAVIYPSYNHVAIVEQVNSDGSIVISEMGWNYTPGVKNVRTLSAAQAASAGYIY